MCWAAPPARVFSMTYGRTKGQSISLLSEGDEVEAKGWAEARFGRSLLLLGDLTTPLRHLARHWALYAQSTRKIRGLAVRFDGFEIPVASVVADDENGAASLLAALGDLNGLLVVNSEQDLPIAIRRRTENTDPWMVALCEGSTTPALEKHGAGPGCCGGGGVPSEIGNAVLVSSDVPIRPHVRSAFSELLLYLRGGSKLRARRYALRTYRSPPHRPRGAWSVFRFAGSRGRAF